MQRFSLSALTLGVALSLAASAFAAPVNTPFLSVDFNGSGGGAPTGPTQAGFQAFGVSNPAGATSLTNSYVVGANTYSVNLAMSAAASGTPTNFTSRDRGANGSATASNLLRDFALLLRDTNFGLGTSHFVLSVGGLAANTSYEFTGYAEDQNSAGPGTNREGFATVAPSGYQPAAAYANAPTGAAYHYTAPMLAPNGQYDQAVSFNATTNASGVLTVYVYADTDSYSNQTATILNGFEIGAATPEPASLALIGVGGLVALRRRRA